ncbi:formate/nitrite transporter family protein [Halocatena pleomorpha]|uniref:Formate/nitrite transporter family protein n=1 Tax=Halocatena pleomorpha TaxID=1785090 RepID=A0A3P3R7H1_9EURY|nr:formate/nitrite transporter family protein [Halocatena pleomorpha]RRJ29396.1 formate/nitrite transporter family protein [Halocatena pleomorpha]
MTVAPSPAEIFDRAVEEGERRLDQSALELVATSFIAGFTVVFGIVALGIVHAAVKPLSGALASVAGALAFGPGLIFLVIGRTELFNENFFSPVAKAVNQPDSWMVVPLLRLWSVTFVVNLIGGVLMALVFSVEGALTPATAASLRTSANEFVHRAPLAKFADAIAGGILVSLLSFLLEAADSVRDRITLAYIVGFLLALGPFDHVIVTVLHVVFGMLFDASIGVGTLARMTVVITAGNVVGGLGLVTLTHIVQVRGARESDS